MPTAEDFERLHHSDQRLVRTVDSLHPDQWREPSLLPAWSRAHVVAHLTLNAEGFAGALDGLISGSHTAIYPSNEARNDAIEELAGADAGEIRERLFAAGQHLRDTFEHLTAEHWDGTVNRLPEGPVWPVPNLLESRQREVEIHHADLGLDYTHQDWPAEFAVHLVDTVAESQDFSLHATDFGRTWSVGDEAPVVSGTAADLGWWLVGRGDGEGLTADGGLPPLGPWQRP